MSRGKAGRSDPLEILILGSGTAIPTPRRAGPSALLIDGERKYLLDLGMGALRNLAAAGYDYEEVEGVFLSHFHPDHTAELVSLLFASKNPFRLRERDLFIAGPPGLKRLLDGLEEVYGDWVRPERYALAVREIPEEGMHIGALRVRTAPVLHTDSSLAYRFEGGGETFVYSGDTDFCPSIVEIASGADLLLLECSFPDGRKAEGHLTPSEAGRVALEAGVGKLVLTHFYPVCDNYDMLGPCRKVFPGEAVLAEDLMRIPVGEVGE